MWVNNWFRALLALPLLALPACGGSGVDNSSPPESGPVLYGVRYPDARNYDSAAADSQYEKCATLPGASADGTQESLPPGRTLRFTGTASEQEVVAECLASLPGAEVTGPFEPPTG